MVDPGQQSRGKPRREWHGPVKEDAGSKDLVTLGREALDRSVWRGCLKRTARNLASPLQER